MCFFQIQEYNYDRHTDHIHDVVSTQRVKSVGNSIGTSVDMLVQE